MPIQIITSIIKQCSIIQCMWKWGRVTQTSVLSMIPEGYIILNSQWKIKKVASLQGFRAQNLNSLYRLLNLIVTDNILSSRQFPWPRRRNLATVILYAIGKDTKVHLSTYSEWCKAKFKTWWCCIVKKRNREEEKKWRTKEEREERKQLERSKKRTILWFQK